MAQSSGAGEIYPGVPVDPAVVHGKPVFTGTRILIAPVLGALAAGDSMETVCEAYGLTPEKAQASATRPVWWCQNQSIAFKCKCTELYDR